MSFDDRDDPGNSSEYRTGKPCIEPDCTRPAGTRWSPLWCIDHNVERMKRIGDQLRRAAGKPTNHEEDGP